MEHGADPRIGAAAAVLLRVRIPVLAAAFGTMLSSQGEMPRRYVLFDDGRDAMLMGSVPDEQPWLAQWQ